MNKETEELIVFGFIGIVVIMMLSNSSSAASSLGIAKVTGSTDSTYANDAAGVVESLAGDF